MYDPTIPYNPNDMVTKDNSSYILLDTPSLLVTTIAGNHTQLPGYSDGIGSESIFNTPLASAFDSAGVLYVADETSIRKCTINSHGEYVVETILGGANAGDTVIGNSGPSTGVNGVAFRNISAMVIDNNHMFASDNTQGQIYSINLTTNTVLAVEMPDGAGEPRGLTSDTNGNIYGSFKDDTNGNSIWLIYSSENSFIDPAKIYPATSNSDQFTEIGPICADALGNIYVFDIAAFSLYRISISSDERTYICGSGAMGYLDSDKPAEAAFGPVFGITINQDSIYLADLFNHRIRKVSPVETSYTTITVLGTWPTSTSLSSAAWRDGDSTLAILNLPTSVSLDATGNIYITELVNRDVRKAYSLNYSLDLVVSGNSDSSIKPLTENFMVGCSDNQLSYSYDGITWDNSVYAAETIIIPSVQRNCIAWNGSIWLSGGGETENSPNDSRMYIDYSSDGIHWTRNNVTNPFRGAICKCLAWTGSMWVAGTSCKTFNYYLSEYGVGEATPQVNTLGYSTDGINWTISTGSLLFNDISSNTQHDPYNLDQFIQGQTNSNYVCNTIAANGKLVVAGGQMGEIMTSSDHGVTWTLNTLSLFSTCNKVIWNGTKWLMAGTTVDKFKGLIAYSTDGKQWFPSVSSSLLCTGDVDTQPNTYASVAWNGSQFIATGYYNEATITIAIIVKSSDGITWTQATIPIVQHIITIAWNGSFWLAGGYNTLLTSVDGLIWINQPNNIYYNGIWNDIVSRKPPQISVASTESGLSWKGVYNPLTTYKLNDLFTINNSLYIYTGVSAPTTYSWNNIPGTIPTGSFGGIFVEKRASPALDRVFISFGLSIYSLGVNEANPFDPVYTNGETEYFGQLFTVGNKIYVVNTTSSSVGLIDTNDSSYTILVSAGGTPTYFVDTTFLSSFIPSGIAVDSTGNLYISDYINHVIIKAPSNSTILEIFAGTIGINGSENGIGTLAKFNGPKGLALDTSGNLYVADNANSSVRKINLETREVVTVISSLSIEPEFITLDKIGNIYVSASTGAGAQGVYKITGGQASVINAKDNNNYPLLLTGCASSVDSDGNIYTYDIVNSKLYNITPVISPPYELMVQASSTDIANPNPTPVEVSYPLPVLIPSGITQLPNLYIQEIDLTSTTVGTLHVVNTLLLDNTNSNLSTVVFLYQPTLPSGFYVYLKNPGNINVTVYAVPRGTSYWIQGITPEPAPPEGSNHIPATPVINANNGYGPSVIYAPFVISEGARSNVSTSYIFWDGTNLNMA